VKKDIPKHKTESKDLEKGKARKYFVALSGMKVTF
jgi:hypothetical protein